MRRALVTGGDGSLGTEISETLAMLGYDVVAAPRGLSTQEEISAFMARLDLEANPFESVVLNDGTNHLAWIGEVPPGDDKIIGVNLLGQFWWLNWLVANQSKPARVVAISSQTYRVPQRTTALYCASKAGLNQMMRVAARELAPRGWVLNVLAPGKIQDTVMSQITDAQVEKLRNWDTKSAEKYALGQIPAGRFTTRREVASAVLWLLSAPKYVNGAVIDMMGGV